MKKTMIMVMAAMAIGFASCGNKAQQAAPADEVVAADSTVEVDVASAISEATAQLTEQIEAKDASKLQQCIEAVQAKVAEILKQNPEAAKEYVAKVQDFLKENAEKIKAVAGDNVAIQSAVNALTAAPAESIVSGLMNVVGDAKAAAGAATDAAQEAAEGAADAAKSAAEGAVEAAKQAAEDKANEVKDAAKQKANEAVDAAADKAKKALGL